MNEPVLPAARSSWWLAGASAPLPASRPLVLGGEDAAYFIEDGTVELFSVEMVAGEPAGFRDHVATLTEGQALFAVGWASSVGACFMAVGHPGTRLRRWPLADLAAVPPGELASAVDAWLEALGRGVTQHIALSPRADLQVEAGRPFTARAGQCLRAAREVVWVPGLSRAADFLGLHDLAADEPGAAHAMPLAPAIWVDYQGAPASFTAVPTAERLAHPGFWTELGAFHRLAAESEAFNKRLRSVDEFLRQQSQGAYRRHAAETAWAEIASVLAPEGEAARPAAAAPAGLHGPLFAALARVANALGISLERPADLDAWPASLGPLDAAGRIARASRTRFRKVALRPGWNRQDHGPLLAWRDAAPVALLFHPKEGYAALDEHGRRIPVRADDLPRFQPFGISLYRSFPDAPMDAPAWFRFLRQGAGSDVRVLLAMSALAGVLAALPPALTAWLYDFVIPQAEHGQLFQMVVGLSAAALAAGVFESVRGLTVLRLESRADHHVQAALWDRLLKLPATFFRGFTAGDLADRANGIAHMRLLLSNVGAAALLGLPASIFNLALMAVYSWRLTLAAVGLALFAGAVTFCLSALQMRYLREQFRMQGRLAGRLFEFIQGVAKLRLAGAEDHAFAVWASDFAHQRRLAFRAGRLANLNRAFLGGFTLAATAGLYAVYAGLAQPATAGQLSAGTFVAFTTAFGIFLAAVLALATAALGLLGLIPLVERVKPILETIPESDALRAHPGQLSGAIDLLNVTFRYRDDLPVVLDDLSLSVRPGEFVAIAGPSGCGKSTLLRLLLGFEKPTQGTILYDSRELDSLDLREVRRQIGVVLQTSRLVTGDVFRNIVGESDLTLDDAWQAAEACGLADDIRRMPMGMHTIVSEGGAGFSGGQRQRLMIARALVHKPRLVFFDEATSALDNRTQAIVTETLDRLQATRLVIAHRLSTIRHADRIVVLRDGRVEEEGRFEALMDRRGFFHQLAQRQMA